MIFKNSKINDVVKYSFVKYIALMVAFLKEIVNARVLGPEFLGVLGNLMLILSYLSYLNLGILFSMNREYVIYESNNDKIGTKEVMRTSFTSLTILSILMFIIGMGMNFLYRGDLGKYIFLIFIIGALEQYKTFYINYFRLINDFQSINYIELINYVLSFIIVVISINYLKIYSVLIAMFIADIIVFIYGYKNSEKIKFNINVTMLGELIKCGIPLLIYNLGFYMLTTVDRIMIIKFLGYEDLGYYTFSNQIVSGTLVFTSSILFLYYPKAIKKLNINNENNVQQILVRTEKYTKYVEVFGVVLCVLGAILIKPFVNIVVPKYVESINIYRILIFGSMVNQVAYFFNVFIVSNRKQVYLIYLQVIDILLAVIFNLIFIKFGMGINGVAMATLIANIIYSVMQYEIYVRILNIEGKHLKNILKLYSKIIVYTCISIILSLMDLNYVLYDFLIFTVMIVLYCKDLIKIAKYMLSINK